jgi:hypothetical protein
MHTTEETREYWTKGFHRLGASIRAALPVRGTISGTTSVTYSTYTTEYRVDDVLVLGDSDIEPGLSGAPVLDRATGVAVGIVSTKLTGKSGQGGFAIPAGHAASHRAFATIMAHNAATVPAYGPFLNTPAARILCEAVTGSAVRELATLRRVDLSHRVARADFVLVADRFLEARANLLTLVGPSGVGKSTELAALAQRIGSSAILLRGSAMHQDCTDLGEAIATALDEVPGNPVLPDRPALILARALASVGGLVVLLDGINEAPLSGHGFEEWIARTQAWLEEANARLIVSCRPELWQNVKHLLGNPADAREPSVVWLGEFSSSEYEHAAVAYGLPSAVQWPILRLPLAMSLYTSSRTKPTPGEVGLSINDVVKSFVEESARRLSIAVGIGSAEIIINRMRAAAEIMLEGATDVIDALSLDQALGFPLADAHVVAEGIMVPARDGYRFIYDDVADWLKARCLDLEVELSAICQTKRYPWRRIGPLTYALRDAGHRAGEEKLRIWLIELVHATQSIDSQACQTAVSTLLKIANAEPVCIQP